MYKKPEHYWSDSAISANHFWQQYKECMHAVTLSREGSRVQAANKRYATVLYWKALIGQGYRQLEDIDHLVNTKQISTQRWNRLGQAGLRRVQRRERKNNERIERSIFNRRVYAT